MVMDSRNIWRLSRLYDFSFCGTTFCLHVRILLLSTFILQGHDMAVTDWQLWITRKLSETNTRNMLAISIHTHTHTHTTAGQFRLLVKSPLFVGKTSFYYWLAANRTCHRYEQTRFHEVGLAFSDNPLATCKRKMSKRYATSVYSRLNCTCRSYAKSVDYRYLSLWILLGNFCAMRPVFCIAKYSVQFFSYT